MKYEILNEIDDILNLTHSRKIEFRQLYGFTFVFKTDIVNINENITSAEIKNIGIIYEENDEYYFAPLYDVEDIDEIIREYVKTL